MPSRLCELCPPHVGCGLDPRRPRRHQARSGEAAVEPEDVAALLDMAEDVINTIGADVLAEHRAAQAKKDKGRFPKFRRKRGKR